jgi:hypothetical protein
MNGEEYLMGQGGNVDILGAVFDAARAAAAKGGTGWRATPVNRAIGPVNTGNSVPVYSSPGLPAMPQQGSVSLLRSAIGFGVATWGPAVATDFVLTIEPQETFRGERLVISTAAAGGTSAGIVVVRRIEIGTLPQSPSVEQPMPAAMFSPDVTYSGLDLQIAKSGTKISITMGITAAPGAGVTVTAVVGMYGGWVR